MWRKSVSAAILLVATAAWAAKGVPTASPLSRAGNAVKPAPAVTVSPLSVSEHGRLSVAHLPAHPLQVAGGTGAHLFQNEDTLRFDDPNTVDNNAIGLSSGGTFQAAIHLTADELGAFGGYGIASVVFYHHEAGTHDGRVIVYGPGSLPADTLATETYSVTGAGWYRVDLTSPVPIDPAADLWVSVEITHNAGEYPISVDAGPAVDGKGDWVYADGIPWDELQNFGLDYNWDILAIAVPLQMGEDTLRFDDPATAGSDAIGLTNGGTYQAAIHLTTDELGPYNGSQLLAVSFYHYEAGTHSGRIIIYGPGSLPTDTLATEPYTVTGQGWFRVDLPAPVTIDGSADMWVSVEITHNAGEYPIGVDAGPAVDGKGDWVYADGLPWDELQNFGLDYNWDILALVGAGGGGPAHDVATLSILAPTGYLFLNDMVTPQAKVRNFGSNTETFDVTFKIFDASLNEVYSDVQTVTDLAPGATETVSFTDFTATATGTFITLAYVSLSGDENPANDSATGDFTVLEGQMDYVIIDLDPTPLTGPMLQNALAALGLTGVYTTDPNEFNNLALYKSLWVLCGIYSNNTQITPDQGAQIEAFLTNGGAFFLEGGDVWGYDPGTGAWDPGPWTGVTGADDGSADLANVLGLDNTLIPGLAGNTWAYAGENNWIDQLTVGPVQGGTAEAIFQNPDVGYNCGVAYDQGTFKSVGVSFELGGLNGTMAFDSVVTLIADFLGVITDVTETSPVLNPVRLQVRTPVRHTAQIAFTLPSAASVSLEVFDISGRRVATLVNGQVAAGTHTVTWNAANSGVYFAKLATPFGTRVQKVVVLR